ncbi:MAG: hypothetical protein JWM11_6390 [Planctomycetaceae bacterium]|nr:hypothetical protein [Planctomycetaceae bacterium]
MTEVIDRRDNNVAFFVDITPFPVNFDGRQTIAERRHALILRFDYDRPRAIDVAPFRSKLRTAKPLATNFCLTCLEVRLFPDL